MTKISWFDVPRSLRAAGPVVLSIRLLLMYRRFVICGLLGIKHKAALFLILRITSPPGKTIDLMSCALRVNASHSIRRFIARRDLPDLSQSSAIKDLASRVGSIPIDPRSFCFRPCSDITG